MQYFLKKNNSKKLVIFFLGWATDYLSFARLDDEGYDVLYVWDYRDIDFAPPIDLAAYNERIVFSFSYGVFISSLIDIDDVSKNVAVNGTLLPIDRTYGIHPKMFDLTLKTLTDVTLRKFYKNMFETEEEYQNFEENSNTRNVCELKEELENIKQLAQSALPAQKKYDKAFTASNDKIIPSKSQNAFWRGKTEHKIFEGSHFPFIKNSKLEDYIK